MAPARDGEEGTDGRRREVTRRRRRRRTVGEGERRSREKGRDGKEGRTICEAKIDGWKARESV